MIATSVDTEALKFHLSAGSNSAFSSAFWSSTWENWENQILKASEFVSLKC